MSIVNKAIFNVDTSIAKPNRLQILRGESVQIDCNFTNYKTPVTLTGMSAMAYWRTKEMKEAGVNAWYSSDAVTIDKSTATWTWSPDDDAGADAYEWFIGLTDEGGLTYRAFGFIQMVGSPGEPNVVPIPLSVLDFDLVEVQNAPWEVDGILKGDGQGGLSAAVADVDYLKSIDAVPTSGSNNPVKSNGVYDALETKANASDLQNYLPISGGTIHGDLNVFGDIGGVDAVFAESFAAVHSTSTRFYETNEIRFMGKGIDDVVLQFPQSGGTIARLEDIPPVDAVPTSGSSNPVSSSGVYEEFQDVVRYRDDKIGAASIDFGPWGYGGNINFDGEHLHFTHPGIHGTSGVDATLSFPVKTGTVATTADIPPAVQVDGVPTSGSPNAVSSSGVYNALADKITADSHVDNQYILSSNNLRASNGKSISVDGSSLGTQIAIKQNSSGVPVIAKTTDNGATWVELSIPTSGGTIALTSDIPAQVNADWNATSGAAAILNKPTIPAAQVNSDWEATSGAAEILNKPTVLPVSGAGNGTYFATTDVQQLVLSNSDQSKFAYLYTPQSSTNTNPALIVTNGELVGTKLRKFQTPFSNNPLTIPDGANANDAVARTSDLPDFETWTFTLSDNTTVTKKVAVYA